MKKTCTILKKTVSALTMLSLTASFFVPNIADAGAVTNSIVATGGTITTVVQNGMTYKVHTFTSSGTFRILSGATAGRKLEVLVVGGGGAGGNGYGGAGGGGAGEVQYQAARGNLSNTSYTVIVGSGGTDGGHGNPGNSGGNSVFDTITAIGGGGGGSINAGGQSGGSGGGGDTPGNSSVGASTHADSGGATSYGNAGGSPGGAYAGGGGGGAGAVGGSYVSGSIGANGGVGKAFSITGSSVYYAGGGAGGGNGGGGTGGSGGGGNGGAGGSQTGFDATANTGGGGGGASNNYQAGGSGGSGIVIVRYLVAGTIMKAVAAPGAISATGGTITTLKDSTGVYKVHTFTSSGTFTVTGSSGKVWYLVVAGGGGGGGGVGHGGGAGGFRTNSAYNYAVSSGNYTVTVGGGGTGGSGFNVQGTSGSDSVFDTITSTGGGGGGGDGGSAGLSGGSGGGGRVTQGAGSGTAGQGNNGGTGPNNFPYNGGGGGGASAVGSNAAANGGAGGDGTASSISGSNATYAGGGGGGNGTSGTGGAGGAGGGGRGSNSSSETGVAGTANTGGGGGGGGYTGGAYSGGGNGGSGVVIIRYKVPNITTKVAPALGLVGWWTFESNDLNWSTGKAFDRSGKGNSGQLISMSTTTSPIVGKLGKALSLSGASQYISITGNSALNLNNNFTMSAWVNIPIGANHDNLGHGVISWGENSAGKRRSILIYNGSGYNQVWFSGYGAPANLNTGISIEDGLWHHLAITLDSSNVARVYIDGVLQGTSGALALNSFTYTNTYIGFAIEPSEYLTGKVDEVRIYNRVLSAAEVLQLYNSR